MLQRDARLPRVRQKAQRNGLNCTCELLLHIMSAPMTRATGRQLAPRVEVELRFLDLFSAG